MDAFWASLEDFVVDWPLWAKILVVVAIGYLGIRFTIKQVVSPLADELRQSLFALRTYFERVFRKPEPESESSPPPRVVPEEITVWESSGIASAHRQYPLSNGIPIITVANMKGGVGKTTLVANLAQDFREQTQKPTLVIDFDYQGSLSQCVRGEAGLTDPDITSDVLFGTTDEDPFLYKRQMRRKIEDIWIYPAHYPLATIENNVLAEWTRANDFRNMYFLCKQLRRPEFQNMFGCVIIDCPPRLTVGSINALCASTHLLVPTTLDDMSAQAAEYFLTQVSRMLGSGLFNLRVIGIVPTMVATKAQVHETATLGRLRKYGRDYWHSESFVLEAGRVVRAAAIARSAGVGVAYVAHASVRETFNQLGNAIRERL